MAESIAPQKTSTKSKRFVRNVLWSWSAVAANLAIALVLNPYMIRKLGAERYGLWALIFTIIDYFWFFDLGLNPAITNFCARYRASGETEKINEVINTALFYFSCICVAAIMLTLALANSVQGFFRVSPAYRAEFSILIKITGISWAICIVMNMFVSALEGFQRFDLESRIWVGALILRAAGYFLILKRGYGLVAMALVYVSVQMLAYICNIESFRRVFQSLRFSRTLVKAGVFREIVSYGLKSFLANGATLVLNQSGPVLIGHYEPTQFVGFYTLPSRILQYAGDAVSRVGIVTRSSAAELSALGETESVVRLGVYSNRYSLALFMPLAILLLVYGRDLILRWVGPAFATYSAPLLPIFLTSTMLVLAGQFNSSSLLYGMGRHGGYARAVAFEALLNVAGMVYVIPRYGIMGAAVISSGFALAVRGIYTPWLVCHNLDFGFVPYLSRIYLRPLLTAVPVALLALLVKFRWIPGRTWPQLSLAALLIGVGYGSLALFTCIEREHRELLLSRIPLVGEHLA
ncbi:MAG: polysaccharide biosynthesis protein [Acidobacteriia bacterium]|nr:polysaccharide biosynthesis protein [Terriglobia bacterium]